MAKNNATLQILFVAIFEGREEIGDRNWNGSRWVDRPAEDITLSIYM